MTEPRLAFSLEVLRNEVDARYPLRNKASDGWLGNAAHQAMPSDHNPNAADVVCALDLTNDPASGADMAVVAEVLRTRPHPDVKYVIRHWDRMMFSAYKAHGVDPFTWRPYSGAGATELHVSVGVGRDGQSVEPYDDRLPSWFAPANDPMHPPAPSPSPSTGPDPQTESELPMLFIAQFPDTSGFLIDTSSGFITALTAEGLATLSSEPSPLKIVHIQGDQNANDLLADLHQIRTRSNV